MRYTLFSILFLFFLSGVLVLRPVPYIYEEKALEVSGIVSGLYESGQYDVSIILKDAKQRYYINRGLENGLRMDSLESKLIGKEVVLKYPSYWTPLDWNNEIRHICYVETDGVIIYNGFKK